MVKDVLVCLDAGHASSTPGKRSPEINGTRLFEYKYVRELVSIISKKLENEGIPVFIVTPELDTDIALSTRAARVNAQCKNHKCLLVSVHGNAAGNGGWANGKGWEIWTTEAKTNSDKFAQCFLDVFSSVFPDRKLRGHKEKNFTIIYKANCPAVLTENFFYDNKEECQFMLKEDTKQRIADLHVKAIKKYISMM